jgi:hypothetical protein
MNDAYSGFTGDAADFSEHPATPCFLCNEIKCKCLDPCDARIRELETQLTQIQKESEHYRQQVIEGDKVIEARDTEIDNWRKVAEGLADGLRKLNNECLAVLSISEQAMRETSGHTNVTCLENRIEEAVQILSAYNKAKAEEGK